MATLVVNGANLPRLSRKIVERLQRGTLGYEALCGWTGSTHQSVAKELHRLRTKGLVEHDGRRPRTWKLKESDEQSDPYNLTQHEEGELRRLWALGYPPAEIARAIGRPANTVSYAAIRLGLRARFARTKEPVTIRKLKEEEAA